MRALDSGPQSGYGRDCVAVRQENGGEQGEDAEVNRFQDAEEQEGARTAPVAHGSVMIEREANPVADAEPVDDAGAPAEQEAEPWTRLAGEGDQKGDEGEGREKCRVEIRKNQDQENGRKQR